ncbi:MAG: hypothetical protein FWG20_00080 [Candidatus Cloacimonetes bacterium]|nr:hypothetical protein [Candidatus Cloacimonadota bacterium]
MKRKIISRVALMVLVLTISVSAKKLSKSEVSLLLSREIHSFGVLAQAWYRTPIVMGGGGSQSIPAGSEERMIEYIIKGQSALKTSKKGNWIESQEGMYLFTIKGDSVVEIVGISKQYRATKCTGVIELKLGHEGIKVTTPNVANQSTTPLVAKLNDKEATKQLYKDLQQAAKLAIDWYSTPVVMGGAGRSDPLSDMFNPLPPQKTDWRSNIERSCPHPRPAKDTGIQLMPPPEILDGIIDSKKPTEITTDPMPPPPRIRRDIEPPVKEQPPRRTGEPLEFLVRYIDHSASGNRIERQNSVLVFSLDELTLHIDAKSISNPHIQFLAEVQLNVGLHTLTTKPEYTPYISDAEAQDLLFKEIFHIATQAHIWWRTPEIMGGRSRDPGQYSQSFESYLKSNAPQKFKQEISFKDNHLHINIASISNPKAKATASMPLNEKLNIDNLKVTPKSKWERFKKN